MRRPTQTDGPLALTSKSGNEEPQMNANRSALMARASALILTTLTVAGAQATPRCDNPTFPVDRVACAKAKESPEALRRFIERTQSIHMLYFWDYMSEADLERHHARRQVPAREATARAQDAGAR
jgi:hypothetical protein